jgi:maleylpyruvate isomerase
MRLVKQRQDELSGLPGGGPSMVLSSTDAEGLWKLGRGAGPEIRGTVGDLAWWLVGRGSGEGLECSTGGLPTLGRWR